MSLQKFVNFLDVALQFALMILFAALVLDVCWQVVTRFILNDPSSYTEEIARYTLIWLSLLGAASAYRRGLHLGIDVVVQKLSSSKQRVARILVHGFVGLFAASILIFGGAKLVLLTLQLQQVSAVLGVKIGWIYSVMPLSGMFFLIFALVFILENLANDPSPSVDSPQ